MGDYDDKSYHGRGGNLGAAFENAWNSAKESGAAPGEYTVEIRIETENPIRGYIVIITPNGG
jgi:hypothetical protein